MQIGGTYIIVQDVGLNVGCLLAKSETILCLFTVMYVSVDVHEVQRSQSTLTHGRPQACL